MAPSARLRFWRRGRAALSPSADPEPKESEAYPDTVTVRMPAMPGRSSATFRMHVRAGADQIARDLFRFGWHGFERPVPDVFARCVGVTDGLVLDVGANTGFYALVAVHALPEATVHAFEPYPPALRCLGENLALNGVAGTRVEVFPCAVSDAVGQAPLYVPDPGHGLIETSCSLNGEFKERLVDQLTVDVVTLDAHVEGLGRPVVGVVKIDVESLEHRVLAGAGRLLDRDRPLVFLEVLPSGDLEGIESIRRAHGYVAVRLRPESAIFGGPVVFDAEGWNQALVPEEKVDGMARTLAGCGLPCLTNGARG